MLIDALSPQNFSPCFLFEQPPSLFAEPATPHYISVPVLGWAEHVALG